MTPEQVGNVLREYKEKVQRIIQQIPGQKYDRADYDYIVWMCERAQGFLNPEDFDKANRWLGFIQGAFWAWDVYSLDEMREHNRNGMLN